MIVDGKATRAKMPTRPMIAARASWNEAMDAKLVELMIDQARAGKRADSGFKKEAWNPLRAR